MSIASGTHEGGVVTRKADAAHTAENLVVKVGTSADSIALAGVSDVAPLGVCLDKPLAAGDTVAVAMLGLALQSTLKVVASAAIVANAVVALAANGKVRTMPTAPGTYIRIGTALSAAAADGDEIALNPETPSTVVVGT